MAPLRLTYRDLGERTGRTPEGARMLARNHRWRIERGNDGKARVVVDETELEAVVEPSGRPPDQPPGQPLDDLPVDHTDTLRLQQQLAEAQADVERWRAEAEQARAIATQAVADRDAARAVAAAEVEAAKRIADTEIAAARRVAEAEIAAAKAEAQAKGQIIAEIKMMLAEARRPWWRKLLDR